MFHNPDNPRRGLSGRYVREARLARENHQSHIVRVDDPTQMCLQCGYVGKLPAPSQDTFEPSRSVDPSPESYDRYQRDMATPPDASYYSRD